MNLLHQLQDVLIIKSNYKKIPFHHERGFLILNNIEDVIFYLKRIRNYCASQEALG